MASLLDSLAHWVEATSALQELEAYVRRHAAVFAERDEYDHACFEIYRGYETLVERLLTDFLEEVRRDAHLSPLGGQWTPERLLSVLREERAVCRRDAAGQRFQVLIAITTFEEFALASQRLRRQAEVEAASLLTGIAFRVAGGAARASPDARLETPGPVTPAEFLPPQR
ncbi:unnamed protein product [Symbiodinium sp. CCMP2456]|nr:unnamed protein product [Symbiodinium sp. CCMP2456]